MTDKEALQKRIDELIEMTSKFCNEYIDAEYAELCKRMIEKLGRKRSSKPLASGQLNIWAAAVVYTIAISNFLFDKSFEPYIPSSVIHDYFGTKQSTITGKASLIRNLLKMSYHFNPEFSTKRALENNPFLTFGSKGGFFFI